MYEIKDLFDKRSIVGARLEEILEEKKCTKAELYKNTGVSRPTIDKLLEGTITNKTNYEKHISKIIHYLQVTPDMLVGNVLCGQNRIREVRNLIQISTDVMAKATGISSDRLKRIEGGEPATKAELRNIAWNLSTSTKVLTGEYFFEPQISDWDLYIELKNKNQIREMSGFWGYVGILLKGNEKHMWFPITTNTGKMIRNEIEGERLVIPCMNNKVLFLYMPNIREISLLDGDCDLPCDENGLAAVKPGSIPLVVYEALVDYCYEMEEREKSEDIPQNLRSFLDEFVKENEWDCDDIRDILNETTIYYEDGRQDSVSIDFYYGTIAEEIESVYGYGLTDMEESFLYFVDSNDESEKFVNMRNIAMIELPLLEVEEEICRRNRA